MFAIELNATALFIQQIRSVGRVDEPVGMIDTKAAARRQFDRLQRGHYLAQAARAAARLVLKLDECTIDRLAFVERIEFLQPAFGGYARTFSSSVPASISRYIVRAVSRLPPSVFIDAAISCIKGAAPAMCEPCSYISDAFSYWPSFQ